MSESNQNFLSLTHSSKMQKHAQRQFFRDIHKWIKDGCPEINDHLFKNYHGLCGNYSKWCYINKKRHAWKPFHFKSPLPFNTCSIQYSDEARNATLYQNAERLAYIKEHS